MSELMEDYYNLRAGEYEEIYNRDDPVRQAEQRKIAEAVKRYFDGRRVLEVACGTGYWTKLLAETAKYICAVDSSPEMLARAKAGKYGCPIDFMLEDAYGLKFKPGYFNGGLANFWFSHIPTKAIESFMESFHRVLGPGARVFMADNVLIPGLGGDLHRPEGSPDTFKLRKLQDGSEHLVLKNYYEPEQLLEIFSRYNSSLSSENIFYGDCFWYIFYELS